MILYIYLAIEKMWENVTGFDDFFFLGFVCVSVLRNEWYYIFVWQPRKCEKMWAISRKCVFYGIFKNTTKYQKIFFEMQLNTWKHFPFQKIAFPKNGIFSGNAFTRTKRSLSIIRLPWFSCFLPNSVIFYFTLRLIIL